MAALSTRQPPVSGPSDERSRPLRPRTEVALAAGLLLVLALFTLHFDHPPRRPIIHALPDVARATLAALVLFTGFGLGLTRLWLPERLREHEALWILPTGACAAGLALTVLGLVHVPYALSLAVLGVSALALDVVVLRRHGRPQVSGRTLAWPLLLAFVVFGVALVPVLSEQHYLAVIGTGSDAHVAAGTANFLKHSAPNGIAPGLPIDRMPPLWGSKYPIYYALAAVSTLSGLETWQVLPVVVAVMLALAAIGMFLVARTVLGAGPGVALAAMGVAGLDRMALHTGLNPYFNQTWGYFALPFTLALGWWVVQPDIERRSRNRAIVLLAMFTIVLVFAYPLAAPIPAVPITVFLISERRRRLRAGERVLRLRDLYRGRRSLLWILPVCAVLLFPAGAVLAKAVGAAGVLAPGHSLAQWGGDLRSFIPFNFFLSLPQTKLGDLLVLVIYYLAYRGLKDQPRALAWGLGGLLTVSLLMAAYLRHRAYGYYFHFKLLAFCGPLLLAVAVVGAGRLRRRARRFWLVILALASYFAAAAEIGATGFQLSTAEIQLHSWAAAIPAGSAVRLDMDPGTQLWAAYMLSARPLCSEHPILDTDYPHVPVSRKAQYIVTSHTGAVPGDAQGPPLRINQGFALYVEKASVPGVQNCSLRRRSRLFQSPDYSPQ